LRASGIPIIPLSFPVDEPGVEKGAWLGGVIAYGYEAEAVTE